MRPIASGPGPAPSRRGSAPSASLAALGRLQPRRRRLRLQVLRAVFFLLRLRQPFVQRRAEHPETRRRDVLAPRVIARHPSALAPSSSSASPTATVSAQTRLVLLQFLVDATRDKALEDDPHPLGELVDDGGDQGARI